MRRRILLLVVGVTLLVVLAFAIPLALLIRTAVVRDAEHGLVDRAQTVALYLRGDPTRVQITSLLAGYEQSGSRSTSVTLPDGTVLGKAIKAPGPVGPTSTGYPGQASGYAPGRGPDAGGGTGGDTGGGSPNSGPEQAQPQLTNVSGGETAQQIVRSDAGTYRIIVFESNNALQSGATGWWLLLAGASAFLLLLGAVGGELLTRRIVRPLLVTAQTAHRISVGDVTARAPTTGPREVAEVGTALNRLADRIDGLIAEERETVADLSHRLRTPLTSLRLDAEALRDPIEAERVGAHVSEVERTLTAVIRAARRPQREGRMPSSDATSVVGERVTFWSALADDQGRGWQVALPARPLPVRAGAEDLGAAVDALLENIIAHTPEGAGFSVSLEPTDTGAALVISDDGPGIAVDALARGRSDRGSSGLGLDIARRCAESGGGSMVIDRGPSGGARVTLLFNAP
jgi:signal transduction histidine kinase